MEWAALGAPSEVRAFDSNIEVGEPGGPDSKLHLWGGHVCGFKVPNAGLFHLANQSIAGESFPTL